MKCQNSVVLADECELITKGTTPSTLGFAVTDEGVPFVRAQNLVDGTVSIDVDPLFIDRATHQALGRSKIKPADLLLSIAGTIGRAAIVPCSADEMNCNQAVAIIRPSPQIDRRYLLHWFGSRDAQGQINRGKVTGTISNLSLGQIASLRVPLPPLDEQRRIAAILDKADALRRKRKRALDLLDGLTQAVFHATFGSLDRYDRTRFSEILERPLRNGLSPAKGGKLPGTVLTLSAITSKVFKPDAAKSAMFDMMPPSDQRVHKDEFLICRGNGNRSLVGVGVFSLVSMPDTVFPDTIIAGRVDQSRFHPRFFETIWNSSVVREQIEKSARTTNGTFKVNQKSLEAIEIPSPDIELQKQYAESSITIDNIRARYREQLQGSDALFSSIQQRAFSGQPGPNELHLPQARLSLLSIW